MFNMRFNITFFISFYANTIFQGMYYITITYKFYVYRLQML